MGPQRRLRAASTLAVINSAPPPAWHSFRGVMAGLIRAAAHPSASGVARTRA
jgi:hypothetical protein